MTHLENAERLLPILYTPTSGQNTIEDQSGSQLNSQASGGIQLLWLLLKQAQMD